MGWSTVLNVYGQRLGTADQATVVVGGPWWRRETGGPWWGSVVNGTLEISTRIHQFAFRCQMSLEGRNGEVTKAERCMESA